KNDKEIIQYNRNQINELNEQVDKLRKEWVEVDKTQYEHNEECVCPTCKQDLPVEQVEKARNKAENDFNERKASKLESIVKEAESVQNRIESIEKDIEKLERNIEKYNK